MEPGLTWRLGFISFRRRGLVQTRSNKRQKELARKEKQRAKQERRDERKRDKETRAPRPAPGGQGSPRHRRNRPGPAAPPRGRRAAALASSAGELASAAQRRFR